MNSRGIPWPVVQRCTWKESYSEKNIYIPLCTAENLTHFSLYFHDNYMEVFYKNVILVCLKKKKHQNVRSFKQMKPNQMHPDASSNSMKVPID